MFTFSPMGGKDKETQETVGKTHCFWVWKRMSLAPSVNRAMREAELAPSLERQSGEMRTHSMQSTSSLRAGKPLWEGYPKKNAQLARVRALFNIKGNLSHL